jgi:hypothetical protein
MWALLAAVALILAGGAAQAQSANESEHTERPDRTPKSAPELRETNKPPSMAPELSGAMRPETSGKKDDASMPQPDWIVSETTSPVDYSPLVSAVIHSTSGEKDGPNIFTVRCRAQRTEVSLGTNGAWGVPRGTLLQVDYQIDDRPSIRQQWVLAADGKTATYKDDAVALLRSIPDGAALKVAVADKDNISREALFQLAGLSAVRQKVAAACKWPRATTRTSSGGR